MDPCLKGLRGSIAALTFMAAAFPNQGTMENDEVAVSWYQSYLRLAYALVMTNIGIENGR